MSINSLPDYVMSRSITINGTLIDCIYISYFVFQIQSGVNNINTNKSYKPYKPYLLPH